MVKEGTSFTGVTLMAKVWLADVAAGAKLSVIVTVTVAKPLTLAVGVKLKTPVGLIAG